METTINAGDFSVTIHSQSVRKVNQHGYTYVALMHNTEYSLTLSNRSESRCDAHVNIDGRFVGVFRIEPYNNIFVERPIAHHRKFTFLQENSYSAEYDGVHPGRSTNGLVSVTFYPEKERYLGELVAATNNCAFGSRCSLRNESYTYGQKSLSSNNLSNIPHAYNFNMDTRTMGEGDFSTGATVLGNNSHQSFNFIHPLTDIDHMKQRTIHFRLIVDNESWPMLDDDEWPMLDRYWSITDDRDDHYYDRTRDTLFTPRLYRRPQSYSRNVGPPPRIDGSQSHIPFW